MEMAAPRGRVLFFGGLPKGTTHIQFPSNVLHYQEVQVHGSYASRHRDQVAALDMLAADAGGIRSRRVGRHRARRDARRLPADPRRRGAQGRRRAVSRRCAASLRHEPRRGAAGADPRRASGGPGDRLPVRARAGARRAACLALVDAGGDRDARGGGLRLAAPRLGHLRHAPAGAAPTTSARTSASRR